MRIGSSILQVLQVIPPVEEIGRSVLIKVSLQVPGQDRPLGADNN